MTLAPQVVLADPDQLLSRTLMRVLGENGYAVTLLDSSDAVVEHLQTRHGVDLVMADIDIPGGGLALVQRLKADPDLRIVPVILLATDPPEDLAEQALGAGAADLITKPFRVREVLARVRLHMRVGRELSQARADALARVELVEILREITTSLQPAEIFRVLVRRVAEGLRISRCSIVLAEAGDAIGTLVAAFELPDLEDQAVELRRYPELRRALETGKAVLVRDVSQDPLYASARAEWAAEGQAVPTTSAIAVPFTLAGHRSGLFFLRSTEGDTPLDQHDVHFAENVIRASLSSIEKAYDLQRAVAAQEQMKLLAETDPLTGLFNRRALAEKLKLELDRAERYQTVLTCILADIDHFKDTNDTHGHQVGDLVLQQVAQMLRREQRAVDLIARYGGEEFVVLLPETGASGARIFAERVLRRVAAQRFGDAEHPVQITLSMGLATVPDPRVTDPDSFLAVADANLLKAKADGRNRYRD
ncbi:MAG: diguanylate cyclase [Gemmatimonadales bacterium]|nr:diguanylate cyclase [Gemmatimonadales bacterium]